MKLSFFTTPIHPLEKPFVQSLREDREASLPADKLGYAEAYCGEHTTDPTKIITSCVTFLASLAYKTKNIRLGTDFAPFSKDVAEKAKQSFQPILANFLLPRWVVSHWPKYVEGCEDGGYTPDYSDWRVAKNICVADDMETARAYACDPGSPYVLCYSQLLTKLRAGERLNPFKEEQNMDDNEVTLHYVLDRFVIYGDPQSVTDQIITLREETGPFKHLVYARHDWTAYDLGRRSMILMGEKVLPMLQDATKAEAPAAAA